MYHACRITVKFIGFFVFAEIFVRFSRIRNFREIFANTKIFAKRNFAKIVPFSYDFAFSRKLKNAFSFQSTLFGTRKVFSSEKVWIFSNKFLIYFLSLQQIFADTVPTGILYTEFHKDTHLARILLQR
jgi:hypothetical protein